jgi:two-component system, LytTR family, response regulator
MNVILFENETQESNELASLIEEIGGHSVVGKYNNPLSFEKEMHAQNSDVVFLDIDVPAFDGFQLSQRITAKSGTPVVFVASNRIFAADAFDVDAVDYIVKPITKERLKKALQKTEARLKASMQKISKPTTRDQEFIPHFMNPFGKVVIFTENEYVFLELEDILYIESLLKNTQVITKKGVFKTRETLDSFCKKLPSTSFFRCHRSYIVQVNKIDRLIQSSHSQIVRMIDFESEIPVSRSRSKALKDLLGI